MSCWTGSQDTWISNAVSAVALMLEGPTVGSVGRGHNIQHTLDVVLIMVLTVINANVTP